MAFSEQNPLDYRSGGDRVKTWGAKYKQEITHIYNILNYLLTHQAYGDVAIQDEDGAMKIFTVQIDNGDGTTTTERHLGIGIKTGDNFDWVDIGKVAARFGAPLSSEALTSADVATQQYEAYKLVKTNANGILPTDITGSAAKISGKVIQVNNLSDGQVMVWRAYDGCWHNENKAAVGEGKALEITNGSTTLVVFSGESDQTIDVGKWNDVTLTKTIDNVVDVRYLPTLEGTASETSKLQKATPEAEGRTIAIRDTDGNVLTATADADDESHKSASTANVAAKIKNHNSNSNAHAAAFAQQLDDFKVLIIASPSYYQREQRPTPAQTTITINPTWLNIADSGYMLTEAVTLNLNSTDAWDDSIYASASNRKGRDVYIYALATRNDITPGFVLSLNSTVPTGYTADNSRKIGGFHCLCTDVGSITGHTLTGYVAGDILPQSVWDLSFRAVSENAGMVYVPGIGKWVDIYLPSWQNGGMASVNGGTIVDGSSTPAINGELAVEYFGLVGKELISRDEFLVAMAGSNQGTNIYGSADPVTTGGHKDTANRRMISNYGIEDGCGALWQWGRDQYENYIGSTWTNTNYYLNGYIWQQMPVFNSNIESTAKGQCVGLLRRVLLGAAWNNGANCGSRAANCDNFSAYCSDVVSARGVSSLRGVA